MVAGKRSVLVVASQHSLQTPCLFSIASGHFITKPPFFSGPPLPQRGPQLELPSLRLCGHKGDGERQSGGSRKSTPLFLPSSASTPTGSTRGGHPSPRGPVPCRLIEDPSSQLSSLLSFPLSHMFYFLRSLQMRPEVIFHEKNLLTPERSVLTLSCPCSPHSTVATQELTFHT